jgi:hypothetical protein
MEAMTRKEMVRAGYRACAKSTDLYPWGYRIIEWFCPSLAVKGEPCILVEYTPDVTDARAVRPANIGRVICSTLDEQIAFHRAIGAPVNHQEELFGRPA